MGIILDLFKAVFKKITKLSRPYFVLEENDLKFKIDSDTFYLFPISNIETKTRHDPYVLEAFTFKTKDLYLEYIHTDNSVSWNGQVFSFFINLIKDDLKIKDMQLIKKQEFPAYDFLIYKIDDEYILNFIYIYEINKEVIIVDFKGELFENLLRNFQKDYKYKYKEDKKLSVDLNTSIVKNNALYNYFGISN